MAIVLDAMGSDDHPEPELQAAVQFARDFGEEIILVGRQEILEQRLKALNTGNAPVRIVHAPDVLEMEDKPVDAAKKKPLNSMAVGLGLVKSGEASAFVTAGNTGGAYFNAVTTLRRMPGIARPALTSLVPTRHGRCAFVDTGANADCRPEFLVEFALMGSIYAEKVLGISKPRVGLLANGEEAGKGNQLTKDAYHLLENTGLNFIGNVEPKEVYASHADVVVTDGFTGNIFIKSSEAVAKFVTTLIKEGIQASFIRKLGYLLVKPAFAPLKQKMDPAEVGAAILLGVNGYVFIGHGRSDARALYVALRLAHQTARSGLLDATREAVAAHLAAHPVSPSPAA